VGNALWEGVSLLDVVRDACGGEAGAAAALRGVRFVEFHGADGCHAIHGLNQFLLPAHTPATVPLMAVAASLVVARLVLSARRGGARQVQRGIACDAYERRSAARRPWCACARVVAGRRGWCVIDAIERGSVHTH
jgi:hypothetical protein